MFFGLNLLLTIFFGLCGNSISQITDQVSLNELAENLDIEVSILSNTEHPQHVKVRIKLTNKASRVELRFEPWQLHFDSIRMIEPERMGFEGFQEIELEGQGVNVSHTQGLHFYFEPTEDFVTLKPGVYRAINFEAKDWMVMKTDIMGNMFLTYPGLEPRIITSTQGDQLSFVSDFDHAEKWKRSTEDLLNPYTPQDRYSLYEIEKEKQEDENELRVVPKPVYMSLFSNSSLTHLTVGSDWSIVFERGLQQEALFLASELGIPTTKLFQGLRSGSQVISLALGDVDLSNTSVPTNNSEEAYSIIVNTEEDSINLVGSKSVGVFYAAVTLTSLKNNGMRFPGVVIKDAPRFPYRGFMLDLARNFKTKDQILKLIKVLALYKLNHLHLHLTDDEGWRFQVRALPELTELGAIQCYDGEKDEKCLIPQLGNGPTGTPKFLTTSDYLAILQEARKNHVTIIPEVDMPGHARAAIKSMELRLRRLTERGFPTEGMQTLLSDPNDTSIYTTPQMFSDNAMNPCMDSSYNFISIVMDELIQLHKDIQPLKTFHFGGDEVGRGAWLNSSMCQSLLSQNKSFADLKGHFFKEVARLASEKGVSLMVWEDGIIRGNNIPFPLEDVAINDVIAQTWDSVWEFGTISRTHRLANAGYKVVMSPATHVYFDHPCEPDPEERGYYWATRFTDVKKTFGFNAANFYDNIKTGLFGGEIPEDELCGKNNTECPPLEKPENIIGVSSTFFSETTKTEPHMHYQLFPRILAFAERAWHQADWELMESGEEREKSLNRDWSSFVRAIGQRELTRLDGFGVLYRVSPPGAIRNGKWLQTRTQFPGQSVQYSVDAGSTWSQVKKDQADIGSYNYRIWLRTLTKDKSRSSRVVVLHPMLSTGYSSFKPASQKCVDYIADNLIVIVKSGSGVQEITLLNNGTKIIPGNDNGLWTIYFNSFPINWLLDGSSLPFTQARSSNYEQAGLRVNHIDGSLYSITPVRRSFLNPGRRASLFFTELANIRSKYQILPNWYVSAEGVSARNIRSTTNEQASYVHHFRNLDDESKTPEYIYYNNKARNLNVYLKGCDRIVPSVALCEIYGNHLMNLTSHVWTLVYSTNEERDLAVYLKQTLHKFTNVYKFSISSETESSRNILLNIDPENDILPEAYILSVNQSSLEINIQASTPSGAFYAASSLIQMLTAPDTLGRLYSCYVKDQPRFGYRGIHVDTARHFVSKKEIFSVIEVMSFYKLNKLHLHLSDDEAWRLEIPSFPQLTQLASRTCHDRKQKICLMPQFGSGCQTNSSGNGFYTIKDYKEILIFAESRHVTVIPAFEFPGHARAAIIAMRRRRKIFKDIGSHTEADRYLLDDVFDLSTYYSPQGYTHNVVDACQNSTYRFLKTIINDLKSIHARHQPLEVFHFGGDEVPDRVWKAAPNCGWMTKQEVEEEFVKKIVDMAITANITLASWADFLVSRHSHGNFSNHLIAFPWKTNPSSIGNAHFLANRGYKVVLALANYLYFDHPHLPVSDEPGNVWATNFIDTYKVFSFQPDDVYKNIPCQDCSRLYSQNIKNIIGIQAQMWTELIQSSARFHYMLYPRLLALAERAWFKSSWESDADLRTKEKQFDWARFALKLGSHHLLLLDKFKVKYRVPTPGVKVDKRVVEVNTEFPGLKVQYKNKRGLWRLIEKTIFQVNQLVELRTLSADGKRYSRSVTVKIEPEIPPPTTKAADDSVSLSYGAITLILSLITFIKLFPFSHYLFYQ